MAQHAAAMVSWERFRPGGGTGGAAVYDYGSRQRRLLDRVGDGGTLWLVTSTRRGKEPRRHHLAYKLVDCVAVDPHASIFSGGFPYVVRARDWRSSRHFGFNDATGTLRRLRFASGRPAADVRNLGSRLLGIPELTRDDVALLERLQHRIEQGRNVFLSYAHEDARVAAEIEAELSVRDVSVSRDVSFLQPGQLWQEALREEVKGTDCFVVLVSPSSAASSHVGREVAWALEELESAGLVTRIVPVVLSPEGRDAFPELAPFQWWDFPTGGDRGKAFDRLAAAVAAPAG